ncbi:glycosyl hydrolase [Seonamhaeicola sp.]|uniref:glycosyl hydrolase n=1 Tax=Seonamhaeicola sp. TaxID=1912245 RepID=UPI00262E13AA|nr:glycosyl hydrolase [Seonamhaeicola sp.]
MKLKLLLLLITLTINWSFPKNLNSNKTFSNAVLKNIIKSNSFSNFSSIISLTVGTVNETTSTIEGIPHPSTVIQLSKAITVEAGSNFHITDDTGVISNNDTVVTSSHQVRVTAPDASVRIYAIVLNGPTITNETYTSNHSRVKYQLNYLNITLNDASELIVTAQEADIPLKFSSVNINSENAWLRLDNISPINARDNYLPLIKAYGHPAVLNQNVRIVQYVNGCVIIPHSPTYEAVEIFDGPNLTGNSMKLTPYTYNKVAELGTFNDAVSSFKVKRGYYVTMAQNENGTGYSKVFIAHDNDLVVNTMPDGLVGKVSFARVIPWRWPHKKGHPGNASSTNSAWTYNWNANKTSGLNAEYIPIKHNLSWPSFGKFTSIEGSTQMLGYNEPDRPDQADATVDEMIEQWPRLLESGLRLGSPAPSDGGLNRLYNFIDECDKRNYRVDFVAIHYYRGCASANDFKNFIQAVHQRTGRPIWITEWNNGANWTNCKPQTNQENANKVDSFIQMMDDLPYVERYCIFPYLGGNWNTLNNGNLTATGIVYRDNKSPMAFNPEKEFANSFNPLALPTNLNASFNDSDYSVELTWDDVSDIENAVIIERKENGGSWTEIARIETADINYYKDTDVSFGSYTYRVKQLVVGGNSSPYSDNASTTVINPDHENVALNKTANLIVSSENAGAGYTGIKAVDGNLLDDNSRWVTLTSEDNSYPHWIEIDLAGEYEINGLRLFTGYQGYNKPLEDFQFQYWDGANWTNTINETGNASSEYALSFTPVTTTKVKLNITKEPDLGRVRLYEIEVYGKAASLSVEDVNLHKLINIYPNPVNEGLLNIKGSEHVTSAEIYNVLGVKFNATLTNRSIDVSDLESGLYFLRLNKKLSLKFLKK